MASQSTTANITVATPPPSEDPVSFLSRRPLSLTADLQDPGQGSTRTKFADEVVIEGKKVLEISSDKLFYTEPSVKRDRVSRWSEPVHRKSSFG